MQLEKEVRIANRISEGSELMDELKSLIAAAKADLKSNGIKAALLGEEPEDALIVRAIVLYTKAHFGFDNPDAERFDACYQSLRAHLSLSSDYRGA